MRTAAASAISICEQFSSIEDCFVKRADIARVLGEELAHIDKVPSAEANFWNKLRDHFEARRSSNRLHCYQRRQGKLVSGDRCSRAWPDLAADGVPIPSDRNER